MRINSSFIEERYDSLTRSLGTLRDKAKESVLDLFAAFHSSPIIQLAKSKWQAIASRFKSKNITIISGGSELDVSWNARLVDEVKKIILGKVHYSLLADH